MPRWKVGDRIVFDLYEDQFHFGTVKSITERIGTDTLYEIRWDDGFDDNAGNLIPEWDLYDVVEWEDEIERRTVSNY